MIEDNIMKKIESVDQQFNKFDIEEPAPFNGMIYRGGSDHHSIEDDPEHVDIERYFRTLIMGNRDEGRRTGLPQQPESSPASRSTSSAQPQWVFDPLERIPSAPSVLFHPQQPLSMDGNVFATRTQSTSSTRTNTSESKRPRRAASANDGSDMWDSGVDADDKPTRAQRRTARRQKERDLVKSLDALIPPAAKSEQIKGVGTRALGESGRSQLTVLKDTADFLRLMKQDRSEGGAASTSGDQKVKEQADDVKVSKEDIVSGLQASNSMLCVLVELPTWRIRHINEGLRDLLRLEKDEEQKNAVTLLDFVVQSDVNHLQSFERDLLLQVKGASGMSVSFRLSGQRADGGNQAEAKRNSKSKMSMRDDAEEEKPEASPSGSCDSGNEDKPTLSMSVVWTSRLAALNAENNFYRSLLLVGTRPAGAEGWPQMLKYSP
uniref:Uncharacterized protein n=1 Tax=Hanusia phi TaxID=3032 RepID=A0A7S0E3H0_9CRYP|mmetsp:Transcript_14459/g.33241  ORF Transcript_14459/g.33241 Transcript_14459/m.33241 type:complete len:434 (+) Transcript_14459:102-1403(+)